MPQNTLSSASYVKAQYNQTNVLKNRISIYQYAQQKETWHNWVYRHLPLKPHTTILEVGCGTGLLWQDKHISQTLLLSDRSRAMVASCKKLYKPLIRMDVNTPAIRPHTIDCLIANHLLYHLPDPTQTLATLRKLLKPNGTFIASTHSKYHLDELISLLPAIFPEYNAIKRKPQGFYIETGKDLLQQYFNQVDVYTFNNPLRVPTVESLIQYTHTLFAGIQVKHMAEKQAALTETIKAKGMPFSLTSISGMFICR